LGFKEGIERGVNKDPHKSMHSREVAMVAFGWFMRMVDGEEYECFEYIGIFDLWALDLPHCHR
jgi:hypothetical protein